MVVGIQIFPVIHRFHNISSISQHFRIECEEATEEEDPTDLPVQGPLPEDPEDAPWRKNESGIRKL